MKKLYAFATTWVLLSFFKNDITYAESDSLDFWDLESDKMDHLSNSKLRTEDDNDASSTNNYKRSRIWEFREEPLNVDVINHIKGKQLEYEYVKLINLSILPCHTVTFVRVEVENLRSTPFVTYNKHTATVIISYNLLQSTLSSYDILVKGISLSGCGGDSDLHESHPPLNELDLIADSFEASQYDYKLR